MASSKTREYTLRRIRRVRPLYLGAATTASGLVSLYLLRRNNLTMSQLRDQLREADKSGKDVNQALDDLQQYVLHHMNTSLATESVYPPIQLQYTYERLMAAEQAKVDGQNSQLYINAKDYCEQQNPTSILGRDRVPCIEQYLQDHQAVQAQAIPASLYKFDFVAPRWSPDLAGWSLVLFGLLTLALLTRLIVGVIHKKRAR